jgi:hypothetical protein
LPFSLEREWQARVASEKGEVHAPELLAAELQGSQWWEASHPLTVFTHVSWPPAVSEAEATPPLVAASLLALFDQLQSPTPKPAVPSMCGERRLGDYYFFIAESQGEPRATLVVEFAGADADGEPLRCRVVASDTAVMRGTWVRRDGGVCFPGVTGQTLTPVRMTHKVDAQGQP